MNMTVTEILRYVSIAAILFCIPVFVWALWDRRNRNVEVNKQRSTAHGYKAVKHRTTDDSQMVNPAQ